MKTILRPERTAFSLRSKRNQSGWAEQRRSNAGRALRRELLGKAPKPDLLSWRNIGLMAAGAVLLFNAFGQIEEVVAGQSDIEATRMQVVNAAPEAEKTSDRPNFSTILRREVKRLTRSQFGDGLELGTGDNLNIVFYERPELSGNRTVDGQGRIVLPIIGFVDVRGKSADELQAELGDRYQEISGRTTYVTVEVAKWRPVYVVGMVKTPGAFPFEPGLQVLQAVALSGGLLRHSSDNPLFLKYHEEKVGILQAKDELQSSLALRARLDAEIKNLDKVVAPDRLVRLLGAPTAHSLMQTENEILQLNREAYETERNALSRTIKFAEEEISAENQRLDELRDLHDAQKARIAEAKKLLKRKILSQGSIMSMENEAAVTGSDIREILSNIARVRREVEQNRRQYQMLKTERELKLKSELVSLTQRIQRAENTLSSSVELISQITSVPLTEVSMNNESNLVYELIRNGKATRVGDLESIRPGDVLKVSLDRSVSLFGEGNQRRDIDAGLDTQLPVAGGMIDEVVQQR